MGRGLIWRTIRPATATVALLAASSTALAAAPDGAVIARTGVMARGVPACASCHGLAGQGIGAQNAPRLSGLDADYLERQLDAFASGARQSPVMEPIARKLTADQRSAAAGYFAGLPVAFTSGPVDAGRLKRGKALAEGGAWGVKVPPCASCHGPGGGGVGSFTPPLAGQTQAYLLRQLTHFRQDERRSDSLALMNGLAKRLSPDDLQAVAAYYASLPAPGSGARP